MAAGGGSVTTLGSAIPVHILPNADEAVLSLTMIVEDESKLRLNVLDRRSLHQYTVLLENGLQGCGSRWADNLPVAKVQRLLLSSLGGRDALSTLHVGYTYAGEKEAATLVARLKAGEELKTLLGRTEGGAGDCLLFLFRYAPDEYSEETFSLRLEVVNEDVTSLLARRLARAEAALEEFKAAHCGAQAAAAPASAAPAIIKCTVTQLDTSDRKYCWHVTMAHDKLKLSSDGKNICIQESGNYEVVVRGCFQGSQYEYLQLHSGGTHLASFYTGYNANGVIVGCTFTEVFSFDAGASISLLGTRGYGPHMPDAVSWLFQVRRI